MASAFEIVQENRKEIVKEIIEMMESGYFFNKPEWSDIGLRPNNPYTNVVYKGGNKIRLMQAAIRNGYSDSRWMTFDQIVKAKYSLEKGSKGVFCEKWIFEKKVKEIDPLTGKEVDVMQPLKTPQVSYFYVYNAKHIKGLPEIEKTYLSDNNVLNTADQLKNSSECKIYELAQDRAFYRPLEDAIYLPLRESFKDDISFLKTLLHEMSHSTGHTSRLDRGLFSGDKDSVNYIKEEIRAELGALFVEKDLGIKLSSENMQDHSNYLKHYTEMLKEDPNELFRACADSEKISNRLIKNYEKTIEIENKNTLTAEQNKPAEQNKEKVTFSFYECSEFHSMGESVENIKNIEQALTLYEKAIKSPLVNQLRPGISAIVNDLEYPLYDGRIQEVYSKSLKENPKIIDALKKCNDYDLLKNKGNLKQNIEKADKDIINEKNIDFGARRELGYIKIVSAEMELER